MRLRVVMIDAGVFCGLATRSIANEHWKAPSLRNSRG
jgi:hypothetical protein